MAREPLKTSEKVTMTDKIITKKQKNDLKIKPDNINSSKIVFHENKKSANMTENQDLVVEQTFEPRQHERSVSINSKHRQAGQNRNAQQQLVSRDEAKPLQTRLRASSEGVKTDLSDSSLLQHHGQYSIDHRHKMDQEKRIDLDVRGKRTIFPRRSGFGLAIAIAEPNKSSATLFEWCWF